MSVLVNPMTAFGNNVTRLQIRCDGDEEGARKAYLNEGAQVVHDAVIYVRPATETEVKQWVSQEIARIFRLKSGDATIEDGQWREPRMFMVFAQRLIEREGNNVHSFLYKLEPSSLSKSLRSSLQSSGYLRAAELQF